MNDFSVDLKMTRDLLSQVPSEICVVSESGIHTREDVGDLSVDAILVGEALITASNVALKVRELAGVSETAEPTVSRGRSVQHDS